MRIRVNKVVSNRGLKFFLFLLLSGLISHCNKGGKEAAKTTEKKTTETKAVEKNTEKEPEDGKTSDEDKKQIAMLFGYDVGKRLGSIVDEEDLDVDTFTESFKAAFAGKENPLTQEQMQKISLIVRGKMQAKQIEMQAKQMKEAEENLAKGKAHLEENKKKEGVKTTASGLQYKVLKEGKGEIPKGNAKVSVHYEGKLLDGTVFDSSYKRGEPVTFPMKAVIKGWTEALELMPVGSTWEVTIPSELAYGDKANPSIPGNSVLKFKIELLNIEKEKKAEAKKTETKKVEAKKEETKKEETKKEETKKEETKTENKK
mgnify:CR=1 FL=1